MYGYIYKITNKINGKVYIGQHKFSKYPKIDGGYWGGGHLLRKAYIKYGIKNFEREILEWCEDKLKTNIRELELTFEHKAFISQGGYVLRAGSNNNQQVSEYTKNKVSESLIGNKRALGMKHRDDVRERISKSLINNKRLLGFKFSEESKIKMSNKLVGNTRRRGKKFSLESCLKLSEAQKRRYKHD